MLRETLYSLGDRTTRENNHFSRLSWGILLPIVSFFGGSCRRQSRQQIVSLIQAKCIYDPSRISIVLNKNLFSNQSHLLIPQKTAFLGSVQLKRGPRLSKCSEERRGAPPHCETSAADSLPSTGLPPNSTSPCNLAANV